MAGDRSASVAGLVLLAAGLLGLAGAVSQELPLVWLLAELARRGPASGCTT